MLSIHNRNIYDRTVMVVEDSPDTRQILCLTLWEQGYKVIAAEDGNKAVEMARKSCPDLILMDLNLPSMDGLAATEQIRDCREVCSDVPILAITAHDVYGMKEAALEAGCNGYITKPVDFDRLKEIVGRVLNC